MTDPDNDLVLRLARRVREIRHATGLGQDAYAREIGVHRTYVSRIERGRANLTMQSVTRLARAMGVTTDDLLLTDEHRTEHVG